MKVLSSVILVLFGLGPLASFAEPCPPQICTAEGCSASICPVQNPTVIEGYGSSSSFGSGGELCTVTSLADSGNGSLRNCVVNRTGSASNPVPRTVNFAVSGDIVLLSDLRIVQPYLTIDGLSAPGVGITVRKSGSGEHGETEITTWPAQSTCGHDVLVQGLRFVGVWNQQTTSHSQNADLLSIDGEDFAGCIENVVIWRNTYSNGQDAVGQIWGSVKNVTFAYNLVIDSFHPQSISHWPGGESNQVRENLSIHHNVYAYNQERQPNIRGNVWNLNFEENLVYEWGAWFAGGYASRFRCRGGGCPMRINMIGNYYLQGSDSESAILFGDGADPSQVYSANNYAPGSAQGAAVAPFPRSDQVSVFQDASFLGLVGQPHRSSRELQVMSEIQQSWSEVN